MEAKETGLIRPAFHLLQERFPLGIGPAVAVPVGPAVFATMVEEPDVVVLTFERLDLILDELVESIEQVLDVSGDIEVHRSTLALALPLIPCQAQPVANLTSREHAPVGPDGHGLRALVIGPGAIGCALGAAFTESGTDVTFLGRTSFSTLNVSHRGGVIEKPAVVLTDTAAVMQSPEFDLVVVATKANQISGVADVLRLATSGGAPVLVAQNGLQHPARVRPHVGEAVEVVSSVVSLPAHRSGPGSVEVTGPAQLTIPESPVAPLVAALLHDSFVDVNVAVDFVTEQWLKLLANASLGAVGVLVRRDNSYLSDPDGRALTIKIMEEIIPVAQAEGANLDDHLAEQMVARIIQRAAGHTSSIVADRLAGAPSEWRERNQIISTLGRKHGLPTPLNDLCTSLIRLGEPDLPKAN